MIPQEPGRPRPRAFEYQDFFDSLTHDPTNGWRSVPVLGDARRGDIIAWRRPVLESGVDTGHVLIVAAAPEADDQGVWTVEEYDSASRPHFDDTRGDGDGQYPSGVGHGHLKFEVDGDGRPVAFLFSPTAPGFTSYPIAIGRVEPVEDPAD